ncbi:Nucleotide-binding protein, UspA family [Halomicrobium sp. LC1Hm]|nr:Nucleotide-binding protein, UspA family [Halomicrobium sp. LC1Hm]
MFYADVTASTMSDALVVVEDIDRDRQLLDRARSFAAGSDSDLVVLSLVTTDEYEEVAETLDAIGKVEHTTYDEGAILDGLASDVSDLAKEVLGEDIAYDVRVEVADEDQADRIITLADETDCDHIFLPGQRRSPTGKAVFGDRTQRVILDFGGYVTVAMD